MEAKRLPLKFQASGRMHRAAFPDGSPECCIGEPKWKVPLGRRDGPVSLATEAVSKLPGDGFTYKQLISNFAPVGLDENDMVALSSAHTIGLTHCGILTPRLYTSPDPTLNNTFVTAQKAACAQNPKRRY
ncbi:hypothetical protein R1sor_019065 [Riccia sorocarpa]|uniref:Plant heme peroxidase family profile domain-containing protein n=1 Tax=Riccia sorocarpa TaxID=122646 RepID=A0ABD3IBK6_9MARC